MWRNATQNFSFLHLELHDTLEKSVRDKLTRGWSKVMALATMTGSLKMKEVGLMKSVDGCGKCSEGLVNEFHVNVPKECDNVMSKEYMRIFYRGKCE